MLQMQQIKKKMLYSDFSVAFISLLPTQLNVGL